MNSILLLDGSYDLNGLSHINPNDYNAVICLFWAAPQTKKKIEKVTGGYCYSLTDIIKSTEFWEMETYNMIKSACDSGPKYKGLPWRSYLTDQIYHECLSLILANATVDFINNT